MEKKLVWNVYREIPNIWKIQPYNIFKHGSFFYDIKKVLKNSKLTKQEKEEEVKRYLRYYFWCKCEHEVMMYGFPPRDDERGLKVDIYSQVMLNWDIFFDYLWKNKALL